MAKGDVGFVTAMQLGGFCSFSHRAIYDIVKSAVLRCRRILTSIKAMDASIDEKAKKKQ